MPNIDGVTVGLIRGDVGVPTMHFGKYRRLVNRARQFPSTYSARYTRFVGGGMPTPEACYGIPALPIDVWEKDGANYRLLRDGAQWPTEVERRGNDDEDAPWIIYALAPDFATIVFDEQAAIDAGSETHPAHDEFWDIGRWVLCSMWLVGLWAERLEIEGIGVREDEG